MLDWGDLRYFLVLARHGSLLGAARELRVAQSTVSRRLASLEASLGAKLLSRTANGYAMTAAGRDIRARVEQLEADALSIENSVAGRDARLAGVVRIACPDLVAAGLLAPCCATLQAKHPDITVEFITYREPAPSMRDADIYVMPSRPTWTYLIGRRACTVEFGLYASPGYLERFGTPDFAQGCAGHQVIAYWHDLQQTVPADWTATLASKARTAVRTENHEAAVLAALHGVGLAGLGRFRADREVGLVRVVAPAPVPDIDVWTVIRRDGRDIARIRAVLTHVTDFMRSQTSVLRPGTPS